MSSPMPHSLSSGAVKTSDVHMRRRFFIGPMPEKVVTDCERKGGSKGEENVRRIVRLHAFNFFVRAGGKPEDWDDDQETDVVREIMSQWHHTEWGKILSRNKKPTPQSRWVGDSFEIGNLLGINVLQQPADNLSRVSTRTTSTQRPLPPNASVAADTFITASEAPQSSSNRAPQINTSPSLLSMPDQPSPSSSSVPLLRPSNSHQLLRHPTIQMPSFAKSEPPLAQGKGKQKLVHYSDVLPRPPRELTRTRSSRPASPTEVLEREGDQVEATSAGAMSSPVDSDDNQWGEIIMRDRMYVRINSTDDELICPQFDEEQHRTTRGLALEEQGEFMVVWRKNRIELYRDYNIPGKEWLTGHKHLSFVIPLKAGSDGRASKTKLSLYSFVDATFSLVSAPTPTITSKIRHFHDHGDGTNIFVFKPKCRSRAFDWLWRLWRHLGGELPSSIEIWNPSLGTKVRMDVPGLNAAQLYQMFTPENIIALCLHSLRSIADYKFLIEKQLADGQVLGLAWRVDTVLDWIWLENDVFDEPRKWAVLCGFAMKSRHPPHLEIRLGQHFSSHVTLRDGTHIDEPPEIEGYLDRIKSNSQTKQQLYLATHDGNLFILNPARAFPPTPFGAKPPTGEEDEEHLGDILRQTEVKRGASQILGATHVTDLRSILTVRRAFQPFVPHRHTEFEHRHQDSSINLMSEPVERADSDEEDEGGDEALVKSADRLHLRMRRSFELLLKNGHVIRFEAYSRKVALEWVEKLRALISYWTHRHRVDARDEMDAAQSRRPRLTPYTHVHQEDEYPEPPADPSAPMPALGSLFNWCVLCGCKPIIRGGKVYTRKGLYGQYQLTQVFLIPGHLVHFSINPKSPMHQSMNRVISLVDAYVCSGYLAAQTLPAGQYNANGGAFARRYGDGLETDDSEEDILFVIWYRPHAVPNTLLDGKTQADVIPSLSSKKKVLVFRTRNKLERDAWCWALNCEIEKIARSKMEREIQLRDTGGLVSG